MDFDDLGLLRAQKLDSFQDRSYSTKYLNKAIESIGPKNLERLIYTSLINTAKLEVDDIFSPNCEELICSVAKTLSIPSDSLAFAAVSMASAIFDKNVEIFCTRGDPVVINILAIFSSVTGQGKSTAMNTVLKSPCSLIEAYCEKEFLFEEACPLKVLDYLATNKGRGTLLLDEATNKLLAIFRSQYHTYKMRAVLNEIYSGGSMKRVLSNGDTNIIEKFRTTLYALGHPTQMIKLTNELAMCTDGLENKYLSLMGQYKPENGNYVQFPRTVSTSFIFDLIGMGLYEGHKDGYFDYYFTDDAIQLLNAIDAETKANLEEFWVLSNLLARSLLKSEEEIPQRCFDAYYQPRAMDMIIRIAIGLGVFTEYTERAFRRGNLYITEPLKFAIGVEYVRKAQILLYVSTRQTRELNRNLRIICQTGISGPEKIRQLSVTSYEEIMFRKVCLLPGIVITVRDLERELRVTHHTVITMLNKWGKAPWHEDFVGSLQKGKGLSNQTIWFWVKCPDTLIRPRVFLSINLSASDYRQSFFASDIIIQRKYKNDNFPYKDLMENFSQQLPNWFPDCDEWVHFYTAMKERGLVQMNTLSNTFPPVDEVSDQKSISALLDFHFDRNKQEEKKKVNEQQAIRKRISQIKLLSMSADGITKHQEIKTKAYMKRKLRESVNYSPYELRKLHAENNQFANRNSARAIRNSAIVTEMRLVLEAQNDNVAFVKTADGEQTSGGKLGESSMQVIKSDSTSAESETLIQSPSPGGKPIAFFQSFGKRNLTGNDNHNIKPLPIVPNILTPSTSKKPTDIHDILCSDEAIYNEPYSKRSKIIKTNDTKTLTRPGVHTSRLEIPEDQ